MSNLQAMVMNITSAIPTPNVAAEGTNYWQSVSQSIASAIDSALPYVWVLVSLAIIGVGLLCIIGSDRSKEVAKSKFVYICIGAALVLAVKTFLKAPLMTLLNGHGAAHAIRYFAVVVVAGAIWPISFSIFSHLGERRR